MPLALLVNPASAHGRTLKLLPQLEQELDARRISFRVERTRGLADGVERALRAAEAALSERSAARWPAPRPRSGSFPVAAATTSPACSASPASRRPRWRC